MNTNISQQYLNELVKSAASNQTDQSYHDFFEGIKDKEIFFHISNASDGEYKNSQLIVPTVSVGENITAVIFYISPKDNRLGEKYAGISWKKGLEMVSKMKNANGLIIQSLSDDWIAITKNKINEILEKTQNK